jgi:hypothetical protein
MLDLLDILSSWYVVIMFQKISRELKESAIALVASGVKARTAAKAYGISERAVRSGNMETPPAGLAQCQPWTLPLDGQTIDPWGLGPGTAVGTRGPGPGPAGT